MYRDDPGPLAGIWVPEDHHSIRNLLDRLVTSRIERGSHFLSIVKPPEGGRQNRIAQ